MSDCRYTPESMIDADDVWQQVYCARYTRDDVDALFPTPVRIDSLLDPDFLPVIPRVDKFWVVINLLEDWDYKESGRGMEIIIAAYDISFWTRDDTVPRHVNRLVNNLETIEAAISATCELLGWWYTLDNDKKGESNG